MHSGEGKKRAGDDISQRLLDFAVRVIKLVNALPKTVVGRHIAGQLVRSGTSCGSNYEESRGAESRADFVHKLGIALKEIKESRFWLKVISQSKIMKPEQIESLIAECEELSAIIAESIITAKSKK
ncbi:MAG: four helix bundle protein [Deltaproteobacteria bacterium]|nr:four helix bundle protein [Deltaproteobacteria bacterium]